MDERPALNATLGAVVPQMGFAVLCIDLTGFGACAQASENVLAKKAVWYGEPMVGGIIGELQSAYQ